MTRTHRTSSHLHPELAAELTRIPLRQQIRAFINLTKMFRHGGASWIQATKRAARVASKSLR